MYNLHLSEEQLEIRDTVRDFVAQEIKLVVLRAERLEAGDRRLPLALLDKASRMGLRTLALSEDLGGAGADNLTCCIVAEELAVGDADIAATLAETATLGHILLGQLMTPEQRRRFLPAFLADDRYHLAVAEHEPESDTALGVNYHRPLASEERVETTAVRAGNGDWVVNGRKSCVANAHMAKLIAVQVKTDPRAPGLHGLSTLLVPRDAAGLTIRAHETPDRWYHGTCGELVFRDCRVAAKDLLGSEGQTPLGAARSNGRGIPHVAAMNLGVGRAAYEAALDYAQLRVQGGRRIIEHQAIGTKLAEMATKLEVARSMIWRAAWASDHPDAYADRSLADLPLQTIAQVFTAETVLDVAKDAAEVFGAMGVMRDMPLQKYVHDARIFLHSGDGASDAKLRIAEILAGYRRPAAAAREYLAAAGA
jgi:alkylation response protein AidB-like acyl-CoA dehydrogenase